MTHGALATAHFIARELQRDNEQRFHHVQSYTGGIASLPPWTQRTHGLQHRVQMSDRPSDPIEDRRMRATA
jgi:hypothetical protein